VRAVARGQQRQVVTVAGSKGRQANGQEIFWEKRISKFFRSQVVEIPRIRQIKIWKSLHGPKLSL
jgi:hypothetical protein